MFECGELLTCNMCHQRMKSPTKCRVLTCHSCRRHVHPHTALRRSTSGAHVQTVSQAQALTQLRREAAAAAMQDAKIAQIIQKTMDEMVNITIKQNMDHCTPPGASPEELEKYGCVLNRKKFQGGDEDYIGITIDSSTPGPGGKLIRRRRKQYFTSISEAVAYRDRMFPNITTNTSPGTLVSAAVHRATQDSMRIQFKAALCHNAKRKRSEWDWAEISEGTSFNADEARELYETTISPELVHMSSLLPADLGPARVHHKARKIHRESDAAAQSNVTFTLGPCGYIKFRGVTKYGNSYIAKCGKLKKTDSTLLGAALTYDNMIRSTKPQHTNFLTPHEISRGTAIIVKGSFRGEFSIYSGSSGPDVARAGLPCVLRTNGTYAWHFDSEVPRSNRYVFHIPGTLRSTPGRVLVDGVWNQELSDTPLFARIKGFVDRDSNTVELF